ncbi:hypothetical protein [Methylobacter sp.]|uniref:hypothetical protein n=1 Tax=Methylobacter sp. TaxID=2051955 RepID=UPI0024895C72|nr:hypothetical protein [Methylobacter sp.]MDI1278073.1 hypothetical protein [Methylobacter sp.]
MTQSTPSGLVLKISAPDTVTVPITCQLFGDGDKVIQTLKLKVTFKKTKKEDWDKEAEAADASLEESGQKIMLREKVIDIKGLPLERDGVPTEFDAEAMNLVLQEQWITEELWTAILAINQGKRSDAYRALLRKN